MRLFKTISTVYRTLNLVKRFLKYWWWRWLQLSEIWPYRRQIGVNLTSYWSYWRYIGVIGVIDVILELYTPWPMTSSIYKALMSWNHVFIDYSGTVTDIDLPSFLWHSPHRGVLDEPKSELLDAGIQEEKAVEVSAQTDRHS